MKIDLTQTHDVLGAYKANDFLAIRKQYQDLNYAYASN